MKIQPELILIGIALLIIIVFRARSATNLQEKEAGTDFKGKIREVCASAGNPDVCIANGDQVYDICIPCVDNPSGLDGTGVSCTETGDIPMPQGLAGFEGKVSCNDLISKLN
jgi:hypothetical protein